MTIMDKLHIVGACLLQARAGALDGVRIDVEGKDLSRLAHLSPMQRRDDPSFGALYDEVWKALEFKKENEI